MIRDQGGVESKDGKESRTSMGVTVESIVADVPGKSSFLLPVDLLGTALTCGCDGRKLRVLMALIWFSAPWLKRGIEGQIFVSLLDLRFMSGLETTKGNVLLKALLSELEGVQVLGREGSWTRIFENLEVISHEGTGQVVWTFSRPVFGVFQDPKRYAMLDILDARKMTSGIDMMVYQYVRLAWNRKDRKSTLSVEETRVIAGMGKDVELRRVVEKVKRSTARVSRRLDVDIDVVVERHRGARSISRIHLMPSRKL